MDSFLFRTWKKRNYPIIALRRSGSIPSKVYNSHAFPAMLEATTAGLAAGCLVRGYIQITEVSVRSKTIRIELAGEQQGSDLALIDAVGTTDRFVGSKAITDTSKYRFAFLTEANPNKPGTAGIGGCIQLLDRCEERGLFIRFDGPQSHSVRAPVSPGFVSSVKFSCSRCIEINKDVVLRGPFTLALDGEREWTIGPNSSVKMKVQRSGPNVIDVAKVLQLCTVRGHFRELAKEQE
ncbi:MAG: hypothetical protein OXC80_04135 [Gammaproteobacteria bacterium]|nr:hypothetical protein [Gammaproteobacteria bacterium]